VRKEQSAHLFVLSLAGCGPTGSSSNTPPCTGTEGKTPRDLSATGGGTGTRPEPTPAGNGVVGSVDSVDVYGKVSGWARDAQNVEGSTTPIF